jgi:hypothetical protein
MFQVSMHTIRGGVRNRACLVRSQFRGVIMFTLDDVINRSRAVNYCDECGGLLDNDEDDICEECFRELEEDEDDLEWDEDDERPSPKNY